MKKKLILQLVLLLIFAFGSSILQGQNYPKSSKNQKTIIFFASEITPNFEEIREITHLSYFSAASDFMSLNHHKILQNNSIVAYENVDIPNIIESCKNNEADYAVVSLIKFFKIGIGKYVLSSQVVVKMKLYDKSGKLMCESNYDTFRKNARILGSAENSIKLGTKGALKLIKKNLRKNNVVDLPIF